MGQDGPWPEAAGPVVDVEVVGRLGEEPGDLGQLAAVLGEVRLPVGAHAGGQAGRLAQHLARAGDREARREGVAQAAAVAPVPA